MTSKQLLDQYFELDKVRCKKFLLQQGENLQLTGNKLDEYIIKELENYKKRFYYYHTRAFQLENGEVIILHRQFLNKVFYFGYFNEEVHRNPTLEQAKKRMANTSFAQANVDTCLYQYYIKRIQDFNDVYLYQDCENFYVLDTLSPEEVKAESELTIVKPLTVADKAQIIEEFQKEVDKMERKANNYINKWGTKHIYYVLQTHPADDHGDEEEIAFSF